MEFSEIRMIESQVIIQSVVGEGPAGHLPLSAGVEIRNMTFSKRD